MKNKSAQYIYAHVCIERKYDYFLFFFILMKETVNDGRGHRKKKKEK
jgi:hypothetical protein